MAKAAAQAPMQLRSVSLLSAGHLVTDLNQGAIPALLPFLITEHGLTYAAAAGIVFSTNVASTIIQPLFGFAADKISKPWLMPLGLLLAGLGLAVIGFLPAYALIIAAAAISGIGIAAYHPEAARLVNLAAGTRKATAMSFFGVGGISGFALGPVLMTAVLLHFGLKGTAVLALPVTAMALLIISQQTHLSRLSRVAGSGGQGTAETGQKDAWWPFARLGLIVVSRSVLFYGLNTFIPLYWINVLHQSKAAGGTALSVLAFSGVAGNLLGGRAADRFGNRKTLFFSFLMLVPLIPLFLYLENPILALAVLVPIGIFQSFNFSPSVVLGQAYLPNRIGLSSGVTFGIAVAIGGVSTPFLGMVADSHGIWTALASVAFLPLVGLAMVLTLPDPKKIQEQAWADQKT